MWTIVLVHRTRPASCPCCLGRRFGRTVGLAFWLVSSLIVLGGRASGMGQPADVGVSPTRERLIQNLKRQEFSGRPMDLLVTDEPIEGALREIGRVGGVTFDVEPAARRTVTYRIVQRPWDEVLARVLVENGLQVAAGIGSRDLKVFRGVRYVLAFQDSTQARVAGWVAVNYRRILAVTSLAGVGAVVLVWQWRRGTFRRRTARKALLKPEDAEAARRRLQHLLEVAAVYRREDLSLPALAKDLALTPHQLSWLVNDVLHVSFADLVNGARVEEAKRRLVDPLLADISILEIGLDVGFGTKAAFNRAFKKHTGTTPSEYRGTNATQPRVPGRARATTNG